MSRDNDKPIRPRISSSRTSKPSTGRTRPASTRASKPENSKEKAAKRTKEPRLMSQSEAKSYEKSLERTSRKPAGKRTGKSFDTRDKYEKGDNKFGPKKPFKKSFDRNDDAERTRSFVQKRRFDKLSKEVPKESIRLNKYIANSGICLLYTSRCV